LVKKAELPWGLVGGEKKTCKKSENEQETKKNCRGGKEKREKKLAIERGAVGEPHMTGG